MKSASCGTEGTPQVVTNNVDAKGADGLTNTQRLEVDYLRQEITARRWRGPVPEWATPHLRDVLPTGAYDASGAHATSTAMADALAKWNSQSHTREMNASDIHRDITSRQPWSRAAQQILGRHLQCDHVSALRISYAQFMDMARQQPGLSQSEINEAALECWHRGIICEEPPKSTASGTVAASAAKKRQTKHVRLTGTIQCSSDMWE